MRWQPPAYREENDGKESDRPRLPRIQGISSAKMKIQNIRYGILTADCLWGVGALGLAIGLRYARTNEGISFTRHIQAYGLMALVALSAWVLVYFRIGLDGFQGGWQLSAILAKLIVADFFLMIVVLAAWVSGPLPRGGARGLPIRPAASTADGCPQ